MIGERGRTAELYPLVRELLESGVKCTALEIRFPETVAGIAAGAAGDWERAEQHFLAARKQALELPQRSISDGSTPGVTHEMDWTPRRAVPPTNQGNA